MSLHVCVSHWGSVIDGEVAGWRVARPVDSVDKTNGRKMRAGADWTERASAIKREMKTNGHMIGSGDGTQMRGRWGGRRSGQ